MTRESGLYYPDRLRAFTPDELANAEQWAATAVQRSTRTGRSTQRRTA